MKILVFDIGGTSIKYGVCTDHVLGQVQEVPTQAQLGGRHILDKVTALIEQESEYDAIGISTTGQVNGIKGSIIYANSNIPGYTGMEIKKELEEKFRVPVAVENDVNAAALGEAVYGAGKEFSSFLCLTYGTGVGGAIIENKAVYHGSSFSAAEFGAIVTHSEDKLNGSDFYDGCYERYASTTGLVKMAQEYDPSLDSGRKIFARPEDPAIQKILNRWVDEIMLGLSSLTHIFNPGCIILGGGIMSQPLILEMIRERVNRFIMPSYAHVQIKSAALGNSAGLLGANYLASQACCNGN